MGSLDFWRREAIVEDVDKVDADTLDQYIAAINAWSLYFSEGEMLSSIDDVSRTLGDGSGPPSDEDSAVRQLLLTWLNAAARIIDLAAVSGNGSTTLEDIHATEAELLDMNSTPDFRTIEDSLANTNRLSSLFDQEDINRDGAANAVDVQLVINLVLGLDVGGFNIDVNGDGAANALEIQQVINAVLLL